MKKVLLILMAAFPAMLLAQNPDNYSIQGKVGKYSVPARVYLIYEKGGKNVIDSTTITNGEFKFHGYTAEPASAYVVIDPNGVGLTKMQQGKDRIDAVNVFIEKANIVLSPTDSVSKSTISGSKLNDDNKRFNDMLEPFNAQAKQIGDEYRSVNDAQQLNPTFQDAIAAKYKIVQNAQTEALKKFITENPQSYMSLIAMRALVKSGLDFGQLDPYFTGLSPAVKQTELGKGFASAINELKITAIGSPAPDFTQNDVNGTPVSLSSFKGKYVLLDFWASWCGPCRQENPHVVRVFNQYKDKNFVILGVSLDRPEDKAAWLKAIKDDGLAWTQVSDLKYWNNEAAGLYRVSFIPQNFLIDPTGKIIAKNLKGADLDAKMAEIFKM